MSTFYKSTATWVVDFRYDGRPRRWFKAFKPGTPVQQQMQAELQQLFGHHVHDVQARPATDDEERQYLRGEAQVNAMCPVGRAPVPDKTD